MKLMKFVLKWKAVVWLLLCIRKYMTWFEFEMSMIIIYTIINYLIYTFENDIEDHIIFKGNLIYEI